MFAPAQEEQSVRMIHLSRDDDPRNLEARKGITRMHRLVAICEQLQFAQVAVMEAIALAQAPVGLEATGSNLDTNSGTNSV
jgi:hypothetical protein